MSKAPILKSIVEPILAPTRLAAGLIANGPQGALQAGKKSMGIAMGADNEQTDILGKPEDVVAPTPDQVSLPDDNSVANAEAQAMAKERRKAGRSSTLLTGYSGGQSLTASTSAGRQLMGY